ncbi:unnamed protein product [Euphydryas editha]|uniref:DDE Tnp4 domain-containing protein n=1 Tax=Euphydryas editha TaxID=104508 RepID=A0AAU9TFN6_EUPED|nr:unnamed protein product [Euphydryas editha]
MSLDFSIKELAMMALLLDEDNIINTRGVRVARRRMWIHPSLLGRKIEGEYYTLYRHLINDEEKFLQYCRMDVGTFEMILKKITPKIVKRNTRFREAISPREKLIVCLRFLSTGDSYKTIAFSYRLGHSTVQNIVTEVCTAINEILMTEFIPTPSREKWLQIADDMWTMWNFPNCLGALDGKHVAIDAPSNSGSLYFNYKKSFSVVLLALVDANYKFIAVDIGSYGKNSDGGILTNSALGRGLENGTLNVPESSPLPGTNILTPYVILGDEAFALKTYMMRPYPKANVQDDEKIIFNYRLCRGRRLVECAFGILSQTFRVYCRRLKADPRNATSIILTTCILHNITLGNTQNFPGKIHIVFRR